MRRFVDQRLHRGAAGRDPRHVLIEALYRQDMLRLHYDVSITRTAAEAFDARSGNCLSLVIMTAALAHEMGLSVTFQSLLSEPTYTRSGTLVAANHHVNLMLGKRRSPSRMLSPEDQWLTVDFLPQDQIGQPRIQVIGEKTVMAMYMNNRAAETLSQGRVDDSYWWAREALRQDPDYLPAINTLAVVYMRRNRLAAAEHALNQMLATDPTQVSGWSNLVQVLERQGRGAAAAQAAARLAALQPVPPFHFYDQGRQAMERGDFALARGLFERELRRQPYQDEVHFWLGLAHLRLGQRAQALEHLSMAKDYSSTMASHDLYASKLAALRATAPGSVGP